MRKLLITACFLCSLLDVYAQKPVLHGLLKSNDGEALPGATVVLLNESDSTMHSFTISDFEGKFRLKNVSKGDYVLQITFVGFASIKKGISISDATSYELGTIAMTPQDEILGDVTIEAERIPIQIKDDTIQYNAAAFKTQPNATVEELLKKLPGVEVEDDGTIKAQGETVDKILVDGKEFFGDDPQIATKNLPADALDNVQVFDRLSEMAEFTGIDDGTRNKTINLSLKEDKKNGLFGRIKGGYGNGDQYNGKANINQFTKTRQLSFIAAGNNVNEQNFSIDDYINMAGGLQNLMSGGSMELTVDEGIGSALGLGNGGIRDVWSGGLNYNQDIGSKTELGINYFYNRLQNNMVKTSERQNFSGDDIFLSDRDLVDNSIYDNHSLSTRLKYAPSDMQDFTFRSSLKLSNQDISNIEQNASQTDDGTLINETNSEDLRDATAFDYNGSLLYRRKFQKKGRSIAGRASLARNTLDQDARVISQSTFYEDGIPVNEEINQNQIDDNIKNTWGVGMTFTEPLWKGKYLQFNYDGQNYANDSHKDFYDILMDQIDPVFNELLSTQFTSDFIYHKGGLRFMSSTKDANLTVSLQAQSSTLEGNSLQFTEGIQRSFFNWLPNLRYSYRFSTGNSFEFDYSTSVNEPNLGQLQPVVNNTNPLRIYNGNPNLKTEYRHNIGMRYMLYDQFSFTSLFVRTNLSYTENKINNATTIDESLRQIVTPVNVKNDVLFNSSASFSTPIRPIKTKVSLSYNNSYNRGITPINDQENIVSRNNNGFNFKLENRNKKVIDLSVGSRFNWTSTKYSLDESLNQKFLTRTLFASMNIEVLKKWNIGTDFKEISYQGQAFANNQSFPLLTASISRSFLKFDRGQLTLYAYDILGQNRGINRNSEFNYIEDERVNVVGRYVMLSFTYALSVFKK